MVKNFFKLDQTRYRVSPLYIESIMKGVFAKAGVEKVSSSFGNLRLFQISNFE